MHVMCSQERDEPPAVCGVRQQKKPEKLYIVTFMKIKLPSEFEKSGLLPPLLAKRKLTLMLAPEGGSAGCSLTTVWRNRAATVNTGL